MENHHQLRMLGRSLAAAEQKAQRARDNLNDAIRAAHRDGMTQSDISRECGVSRETIRRVIRQNDTGMPSGS